MPDFLYTLSYFIVAKPLQIREHYLCLLSEGKDVQRGTHLVQDHMANKKLKENLSPLPSRYLKNDFLMPQIHIIELTCPISKHLNFGILPPIIFEDDTGNDFVTH